MKIIMKLKFNGDSVFTAQTEGRLPWPVSGVDGFSIDSVDENKGITFLVHDCESIALVILSTVTNKAPIVKLQIDGENRRVTSVESISIYVQSGEYQQHWGWVAL